jgi:ABC-2 type transport system ATP-binding protein
MLVATGLTKSYRGRPAVVGGDLHLGTGRVVGLVGANGAGKTTTIKMVAGLLQPDAGAALLDGNPTLHPDARRRVGYLPEESPLYDDLHPLAYLTFFGGLYDLSRRASRERAEALLRRLGLPEDHWGRPNGQLSKGTRRKVAIARALLHDPDVLVLDEPTSGLDPLTTAEVNAFLRELRRGGKAILLSAHNLQQVEELCDEIVVMHRGRVVDRGTLAELRGRHGTQRYRVRATVPFPHSTPSGPVHEAWLANLTQVEHALEAVRRAQGIVLEVESIPPRLEEILRRAAGE